MGRARRPGGQRGLALISGYEKCNHGTGSASISACEKCNHGSGLGRRRRPSGREDCWGSRRSARLRNATTGQGLGGGDGLTALRTARGCVDQRVGKCNLGSGHGRSRGSRRSVRVRRAPLVLQCGDPQPSGRGAMCEYSITGSTLCARKERVVVELRGSAGRCRQGTWEGRRWTVQTWRPGA